MKTWFFKVCFHECVNLCRSAEVYSSQQGITEGLEVALAEARAAVGAVQVEFSLPHSLKAPGFNP
jgi:hypothetical protein